jgi:hypothetical protein
LGDIVKISEEHNLYLKSGYEQPINAGMISLVFKAYHKDTDKPIIIKMVDAIGLEPMTPSV